MLEPQRRTQDAEPVVADRHADAETREPQACDWCGSLHLAWVKCKLVCRNCRQIVKSCADL